MYTKISDGRITDSLSTVPVMTITDVTASRAFNLWYFNTTGKTLFVLISVQHTSAAAGDSAKVNASVDITIPSGIENGPARSEHSSVTLIVAPNLRYTCDSIVTGASTNVLNRWIEAY